MKHHQISVNTFCDLPNYKENNSTYGYCKQGYHNNILKLSSSFELAIGVSSQLTSCKRIDMQNPVKWNCHMSVFGLANYDDDYPEACRLDISQKWD